MNRLNTTVRKNVVKGMGLGLFVAVAMLLVTQSFIIPLYSDVANRHDTPGTTNISPQDWSFTSPNEFAATLEQTERQAALIGYVFGNGRFVNISGSPVIENQAFYEDYKLLWTQPVYEQYPHTLLIENETEFTLQMVALPNNQWINVTSDVFSGVNTALANLISSATVVEELDDNGLANFVDQYYKVDNTVLTISHFYDDGSLLYFEMINNEVLKIEFRIASAAYVDQNSMNFNTVETHHFLYDLGGVDNNAYINAVISLIQTVGV